MKIRVTHVGTATVLLEIDSLRLLTDPALDRAGQKYRFGPGVGSTKTEDPAFGAESLRTIDAVLVTHDQHADNLDESGRKILPQADRVVTTRSGARRLGGNALGLAPWESLELAGRNGPCVRVTATPARHGPPLSRPLVGEVIGFHLQWPGQERGPLYISGDTVWFGGIAEIGRRLRVGTALLHLGGVRFPLSGPIRYTFDARGAVRAIAALRPEQVIPIHYDGWTHFREPRAHAEEVFAAAGVGERVRWIPKGHPVEIDV
jgi:L-ascorbate metabolism protein UlaG (beta-lactamase superfamily)